MVGERLIKSVNELENTKLTGDAPRDEQTEGICEDVSPSRTYKPTSQPARGAATGDQPASQPEEQQLAARLSVKRAAADSKLASQGIAEEISPRET